MMLVPPLRVPLRSNLQQGLADWLDRVQQQQDQGNGNTNAARTLPDFTAAECMGDLQLLHSLRMQLSDSITRFDSYEEAKELVPVLHEYYAMLLECESRGFPSMQQSSSAASMTIKLEWVGAIDSGSQEMNNQHNQAPLIDCHSGLLLERASILWNLAAIEAYNASKQDVVANKKKWAMANKNLQLAFTFMHHLKETLLVQEEEDKNDPNPHHGSASSSITDFQSSMVVFWENVLQAQAQMAGYEKASIRPKNLLLAKISAGAVPLWDTAAEACNNIRIMSSQQQKSAWHVQSVSWSSYLSAKAEFHESAHAREKNLPGPELARLEKSLQFVNQCHDYLFPNNYAPANDDADSERSSMRRLKDEVPPFLQQVRERYTEAQQQCNEEIPNDVRDTRGELLSKGASALPKTMTELKSPFFANLLGPVARHAISRFQQDMDQFVYSMSAMVEEKTEAARKALASVNLPHSLTAYKQEQNGGGIPMELWERVDTIQRERKVSVLKQELWGLRDVAEQARSIFAKTQKQLEEDVEMDGLFRQHNSSFEGHDVVEIQQSFRQSLSNYEKLLAKSQEGDAVLLRRFEVLDQDPKYKLLQFGKSQLDRLLPGSGGDQSPNIDTTHLSRLLVELSNLFHDREVTLGILKEDVINYDIQERISEVNPESPTASQEYVLAVKKAQKSFSGIAYEIQLNIDKQMELLDTIMQENERFMRDREAGASSAASESCIAMIEDAIEEIDQLTKHLREGKDFYDVVIPKLEHLKHQVGDASVRLTVERCDFEDNHNNSVDRRRQEAEDARLAASLAGPGAGSGGVGVGSGGDHNNSQDQGDEEQRPTDPDHPLSNQPRADYQSRGDHMPAASHPGVVTVSHAEPQVRVDDEKVASLVAMDFDPDKVVDALRKHDNNMEQALNELLSC